MVSKTNTLLLALLFTGFILGGWSIISDHQQKTMPLVPMMRVLLSDMHTVDTGIYTEDYSIIAQGAGAIAEHPAMTNEDRKLIKKVLGEEIKKFVKYDMTVHHHADSMRTAALNKNLQEVLRHYSIVQKGCVDCHSNYRDRISAARKEVNEGE